MRVLAAVYALLILLSATGGAQAESDLELLVGLHSGSFSNAAQVRREAAELAAREQEAVRPRPQRFMVMARVLMPELGSHIVYVQQHEASPEGPVRRQQLWQFRPVAGGLIRMDIFTFANPGAALDLHAKPFQQSLISPADLVAWPEGCYMLWRRLPDRFDGRIDQDHCIMPTRRPGVALELETIHQIRNGEMWVLERGYSRHGHIIEGPLDDDPDHYLALNGAMALQ